MFNRTGVNKMTDKDVNKGIQEITEEEVELSPVGRPTKYKPEYCQEAIKYFKRIPYEPVMITSPETGEEVPMINKFGNPVLMPCPLPTIEGFANELGVVTTTIDSWREKHPAFKGAIIYGKQLQKDILVQNGLMGNYEKTFAKFVAINVTDMKDKVETEHSGSIAMPVVVDDV